MLVCKRYGIKSPFYSDLLQVAKKPTYRVWSKGTKFPVFPCTTTYTWCN